MSGMVWKGSPELRPMLVPLDDLAELPGNPRRGRVAAVARSYDRFGQRKPVVVRSEGGRLVIVAGNHQLGGARMLGWTHLAVASADDLTEVESRAFALADNRTSDLARDDAEGLYALKQIIAAEDESLLVAASWVDEAPPLPLANDAGPDPWDTSDLPTGDGAAIPADYGDDPAAKKVKLVKVRFGSVEMHVSAAEVAPVERAFRTFVELYGTDAGFLRSLCEKGWPYDLDDD